MVLDLFSFPLHELTRLHRNPDHFPVSISKYTSCSLHQYATQRLLIWPLVSPMYVGNRRLNWDSRRIKASRTSTLLLLWIFQILMPIRKFSLQSLYSSIEYDFTGLNFCLKEQGHVNENSVHFTARQRSCRKVIFSRVFLCPPREVG